MQKYDANDLLSTLQYMKTEFGTGIFQDARQMNSILGDLAPALKRDAKILQRLHTAGFFRELEHTDFLNEIAGKQARGRIKNWLIDEECMQEKWAYYYAETLYALFREMTFEGCTNLEKVLISSEETVGEKETFPNGYEYEDFIFATKDGILKSYKKKLKKYAIHTLNNFFHTK